jgi:hypothetical protein
MSRPVGALVLLAILVAWSGPGWPQVRPLPPAVPSETAPPPPHQSGELPCNNCHLGNHQGVVRMYLGLGGHGTPMIPSHMFQVRVQCVACHTAPKEEEKRAGFVGQTFRPTEQACVACHGEKYRGMLVRWVSTLGRMQEILAPKLAAARAALGEADPKNPRHGRARQLVEDSDFNLRFVALGRGVHNVFYAADLLKLSNGWLDQAVALVGKAPARADDTLVRGGYCAVLCHEQAGVKQRETVSFAKQKLPHVRHVTEFGAVCTVCHSAEVHKAVTATAETCSSCHHGPQNERCEGCHRAQSAFYRGQTRTGLVEVEPNVMADAVPCTGCHDFAKKPSRPAIAEACLACHEPPYLALATEWTTGFDTDRVRAAGALKQAEASLAAARRAGRPTAPADALVKAAREALGVVRRSGAAHNPLAADALLGLAREKAEQARAQLGKR